MISDVTYLFSYRHFLQPTSMYFKILQILNVSLDFALNPNTLHSSVESLLCCLIGMCGRILTLVFSGSVLWPGGLGGTLFLPK